MFFLRNRNRIYTKQFTNEGGVAEGALLSFQGKIKDDLLRNFMETYRLHGNPIKNGGVVSSQPILTLIGSGSGALGLSGIMSGNLFMATANPATLMTIGNGVGSAVMGGGGIVAHAPFIPAATALIPVVAPLLAFQTITTLMILNQFKGIHKRLDHIEKTINRIIQRSEAAFIGEVLSSLNRIEELEHEFAISNKFTQDMMIRLALIEDKVNPIFERYRFLYHIPSMGQEIEKEELNFKKNDAYFAIILSILDLRIEFLQMNLTIQDNAGYMQYSAERLVKKVDHYRQLWNEIGFDPKQVETVANDLKRAVEDMNWWEKTMPTWLAGNREKRENNERTISDLENYAKAIKNELNDELSFAAHYGEELQKSLITPQYINLIYWRDALGEHSYYTDDLAILPVAN